MSFAHPAHLHWLWLCPILTAFLVWGNRERRRKMLQFAAAPMLPRLIDLGACQKRARRAILTVFAVIFLVLALSQPRWGFHWEDLRQEGADIVIALDVSRSMLAEDIKPNRLERARRKVKDLLRMLDGDRIGLVAFAGTSFIQCPLTLDYAAAELFLDIIDTDLIPVPGTALAHAIKTSLKAFSAGDKTAKAILLITDGEDHEGDVVAAARQAKQESVKIFAIGIGQDTGAPLPQSGGGFKQNEKGEVVVSRLNEDLLKQAALETGGAYIRSVTGDLDLDKIYRDDIKNTAGKKELRTSRRQLWHERFQWFILAALLCLIWEAIMAERQPPARLARQ